MKSKPGEYKTLRCIHSFPLNNPGSLYAHIYCMVREQRENIHNTQISSIFRYERNLSAKQLAITSLDPNMKDCRCVSFKMCLFLAR
jgi:hypothetical protein